MKTDGDEQRQWRDRRKRKLNVKATGKTKIKKIQAMTWINGINIYSTIQIKSQMSLVTLSLRYTPELNNHQFLLMLPPKYLLKQFPLWFPSNIIHFQTNHLTPELLLWCPRWSVSCILLPPSPPRPHLKPTLPGWTVWNVVIPLIKRLQWFTNGLRIKPRISNLAYWFGPYLCFWSSPCLVRSLLSWPRRNLLLSLFNTRQPQL